MTKETRRTACPESPYDPGGAGALTERTAVSAASEQEHRNDPGFARAMAETKEAIDEMRALGVPYGRALELADRIYTSGMNRGITLAVLHTGGLGTEC